METTEIIVKEVNPIIEEAGCLVVTSDKDVKAVKDFLRKTKDLKDHIEETYHPTENKKKSYALYKGLCDTEKEIYGPITEAETIVKGKARDYDTKKAIAAKKEEDRLEAIRRDKEEKERKKLEAKAEKQIEKGNNEQADQLLEDAENVQVPPVPRPPTNVKKLTKKAKLTNMFQLCKAIANGDVPFSVVAINQTALNAYAKTHDGSKVPGLEFYEEANGRYL